MQSHNALVDGHESRNRIVALLKLHNIREILTNRKHNWRLDLMCKKQRTKAQSRAASHRNLNSKRKKKSSNPPIKRTRWLDSNERSGPLMYEAASCMRAMYA